MLKGITCIYYWLYKGDLLFIFLLTTNDALLWLIWKVYTVYTSVSRIGYTGLTSYELENWETSRLQNVLLLYMRSSVMLCILHSLFTDLAISQKADEPIAFKYKGMIWDVSNFVWAYIGFKIWYAIDILTSDFVAIYAENKIKPGHLNGLIPKFRFKHEPMYNKTEMESSLTLCICYRYHVYETRNYALDPRRIEVVSKLKKLSYLFPWCIRFTRSNNGSYTTFLETRFYFWFISNDLYDM